MKNYFCNWQVFGAFYICSVDTIRYIHFIRTKSFMNCDIYYILDGELFLDIIILAERI